MSFLPFVQAWIWISVAATIAGWVLSALGQLNRLGYLAFSVVVGIGLWVWRRPLRDAIEQQKKRTQTWRWGKIRWRFRHFLPVSFAVLAFLVFLGGVLYPPSNHTALTYRTARVLHWLAEGHWYWVHTPNYRINDRACGIEWLSAPLILFTKSDRGLFLLNYIPFLLLPGLVFSLFTRAGIHPRVAWPWMWLLPTGYTFLLQAGSAGNDTFPTVYALAAVDFACRAWKSRRPSDLWLSILSAALLTGAKASNIPLLLPWGLVLLVLAPLLKRRPLATAAVVILAVLVSFLPTAALNQVCCGDWSGLKLEREGMNMKNPLVGVWGNTFLFLLDNLAPPFFPPAKWWNQSALSILPHSLVAPMVANFEQGFLWLGELPTEDWAGLGFGLSFLIGISFLASFCARGANTRWQLRDALPTGLRWCVLLAPWGSLLAYCVKSGMVTGARLISPYYPLLLMLLLVGAGQAVVVRRKWWRRLAGLSLVLAFAVLVVTPARPLWPAQTVLSRALARKPGNRMLERAFSVYSVYANRADPLANVRALLPPGQGVIGFMGTGDDIDISFWRPFGQTRVKHILLDDSLEQIHHNGIEYAVVGGFNLSFNGTTLEAWTNRTGAQVLATATATLKVSEGPQPWYVVRFPGRNPGHD